MAPAWHVIVMLAVLSVVSTQGSDNGPLVSLKQGRYRGNFIFAPNHINVAEYLGIPFAKPPMYKLRFANPEPVDPQPGRMFFAQKFAPACPQIMDNTFGDFSGSTQWNPPGGIMSEDCLYLNVWVPDKGTRTKKSVMVWIYGGGFESGATSLKMYHGSTLAAFGDVVVVSLSYRLGALGFLSTGDDRIPGNFGMMDQVLALKWVQENIEAFGGDPDSVTLFGESAGAIFTALHLVSPESNGLFHRAIMQSPARLSRYVLNRREAMRRATTLFKEVGCENDDDVVKCLQKLNSGVFLREQSYGMFSETLSFYSTIIPPLLPRSPAEAFLAGNYQHRPVMAGINKDEGAYFLLYSSKAFSLNSESGQTRKNLKSTFKYLLRRLNAEEKERIYDLYTKRITVHDKVGNRDAMDDILGDFMFICPTQNIVDWIANTGVSTYSYYYNYRDSQETWPEWTGVIHGAEIPFVFGLPLNSSLGYTTSERRFSERIMSFWTNFAKVGNPNSQGNDVWPKYTTDRKEYLELSPTEVKREGGHRKEQCDLWNELVAASASYTSYMSAVLLTLITFLIHA